MSSTIATAGHLTALDPVRPSERIAALDVLRGFALLGIMVINLPGFSTPWGLEAAGEVLFPAWHDQAAEWLVDFLGSGKFNSIFSFLFGVGFAIQIERAEARRRSIVGPYLRRLLALFAFGVAHCLLIWGGDVLHIYAILGVPLLLLRRAGDRWLLALAVLLMLAPIGHGAWKYAQQEPDRKTTEQHRADGEEQLRVYGHGTYRQAVALRWKETEEEYTEGEGAWFWAILGTTVLLGFVAGRRRIFQDLPAHLPAIRRFAWRVRGARVRDGRRVRDLRTAGRSHDPDADADRLPRRAPVRPGTAGALPVLYRGDRPSGATGVVAARCWSRWRRWDGCR